MNQVKIRVGNFTSSGISALCTNGKKAGELSAPAKTYIAEKNMERKLGRSISNDMTSRPTSWGNLCEKRVFDLLPMSYKLTSNVTDTHPTIDYWKGSKDGIKEDSEGRTVIDIKCPFTLKAFCNLVDIKTGEELKEENPEYYWQLVSNAIINDCKFAELIVYVPYLKELPTIREMAANTDEEYIYNWISYSKDYDLPYLPNDCTYYTNVNILLFEVSQADKDFITARVLEAGTKLIQL